jgi:hypothetical protein
VPGDLYQQRRHLIKLELCAIHRCQQGRGLIGCARTKRFKHACQHRVLLGVEREIRDTIHPLHHQRDFPVQFEKVFL